MSYASGTISEEASILDFPAVTIRNSMERPEAMDSGSIILTGLEKDVVLTSIDVVMSKSTEMSKYIPNEYEIKNASHRILKLILGTAKLSNTWNSINRLNN